jgi:hypothetical protein
VIIQWQSSTRKAVTTYHDRSDPSQNVRQEVEFPQMLQPSSSSKKLNILQSCFRNSVMYRGAMLNIHKYRLRASSCPDIYRNSMTTIAKENEEVRRPSACAGN